MRKTSKQDFSLATVKSGLQQSATDFMKDIQKELVQEEQDALKDFIKEAYRLSLEKERAVEQLQKEVTEIKSAIEGASKGKWDELSKIKIPARFFEEGTLRKHGKSLVSGGEEIRFLDLYVPEDDK